MKHLIRTQTSKGFGLPQTLPDTLVVTHVGSGQQYTQPLKWRKTATGGQSAREHLRDSAGGQARRLPGRVEQRQGRQRRRRRRHAQLRHRPVPRRGVPPAGARRPHRARATRSRWWPRPRCRPTCRSTTWPAAARPTCRCACRPLVRGKSLSLRRLRRLQLLAAAQGRARPRPTAEEAESAAQDLRVIADKLPLTLDKDGAGKLTIEKMPAGQGRAARAAARSQLRRPQRRGADPAQHADAVAGRRDRRHQDRGLGLDQPEAQVPGAGARPGGQAAGRRDAQRARRRAHHHHQPQAHGGRLLHLRQQDRDQGARHRVQRQERRARPAAVRGRAEGSRPGRADRQRQRQGRPRQPRRQLGLRHAGRASSGSAARTTTASTCCPRRRATSPARSPSSRCAARSASPPRWCRSSAKA